MLMAIAKAMGPGQNKNELIDVCQNAKSFSRREMSVVCRTFARLRVQDRAKAIPQAVTSMETFARLHLQLENNFVRHSFELS